MSKKDKNKITEKCAHCGATDYSVSNDIIMARHCKCGHIWRPRTNDQLLLDDLKEKLEDAKVFKTNMNKILVSIHKMAEAKKYEEIIKLCEGLV